MAKAKSAPIIENEHVKELLAIMSKNNIPGKKDILTLIGQIGTIERQLEAAVNELAAMRRDIVQAQAQNHPIQTTLKNTCITMQGQVLNLRDKLAELKQNFIDGCKNAADAFKGKGISALDSIAKFFNIKPALESFRSELDKCIQFDDRAIAKIEAISTEYHEAGRHLKNIGRTIVDKELIQEAKPMGKVAKAFAAPYRAERKCFVAMKNCTEKAIGCFSRLEERADKPSIKGTIQQFNDQITQANKDVPVPERSIAHDSR